MKCQRFIFDEVLNEIESGELGSQKVMWKGKQREEPAVSEEHVVDTCSGVVDI